MNIFNRRLYKHCLEPYCTIVTGDRGAGKSTVFALVVDCARKNGLDVFCQFPYKDCYQIPLKTNVTKKGYVYTDIDKNWLYNSDLRGCVILIDEAKTVWNARDFKSWSMEDEQFFNFLRKNDIHLFLATQSYDGLDLNVKRACDEVWYLSAGFLHFTHIETSHTTLCKVADRQTEVIGRMFKKGMRKVVWDVCEVPLSNYLFWRKSYYKKFISTFTYDEKKEVVKNSWDEVIDFEQLATR